MLLYSYLHKSKTKKSPIPSPATAHCLNLPNRWHPSLPTPNPIAPDLHLHRFHKLLHILITHLLAIKQIFQVGRLHVLVRVGLFAFLDAEVAFVFYCELFCWAWAVEQGGEGLVDKGVGLEECFGVLFADLLEAFLHGSDDLCGSSNNINIPPTPKFPLYAKTPNPKYYLNPFPNNNNISNPNEINPKPKHLLHLKTPNNPRSTRPLTQDPECQPYIEWLDSENGFNIVNVSGFSMHVLPIYFKHQNFSSFVRQLNMYGFAKVRGKDGENAYEHKYFKRGSKASIKKIQRKISSEPYSRGNELVLYKPSILCEKRKK